MELAVLFSNTFGHDHAKFLLALFFCKESVCLLKLVASLPCSKASKTSVPYSTNKFVFCNC